jgi:cobalt/nickel transport system permease protein
MLPDSVLQRLDPRAQITAALALVVTIVSTPPTHLVAFTAYAGLLSWLAALGRVPFRRILKSVLAILPFSVLTAVWLPLLKGGPLVHPFGSRLALSVSGLWLLAGVLMKSGLGVVTLTILSATTPYDLLLAGLRGLGLPALFVDLLGLTWRYLFVLVDAALRLRRAGAARGYRPRWLPQSLIIGRMVGRLFLRSYERAERIHQAMLLRGYNGRLPVSRSLRFSAGDALVLVVFLPALAAIRFLLH